MHTVEISQNGAEIGTVNFRGITINALDPATALPTDRPQKRQYKCVPAHCISKSVARRIANSLTFGIRAGQEDNFEWHS